MPTIDRRELDRWRRAERRQKFLARVLPPGLPLLVLLLVLLARELLRA